MSLDKAETARTSADDAQLAATDPQGSLITEPPAATLAEPNCIVAAPQPHAALVRAAAAAQPGSAAVPSGSAGAAEQQHPVAAKPAAAAPENLPACTQDKVQKRKVALFLAYVGAGYLGMQRNPGCKTIEGDLHAALVAVGGIIAENADDFGKVSWNRAARTDKGVSAIGQVVSLKMCLHPDIVERLNKELPPAIRVFGYRRVTAGFDARKLCDRRRYEYVLPAYAFDPAACQPRSVAAAEVDAASQPGVATAGSAAAAPPEAVDIPGLAPAGEPAAGVDAAPASTKPGVAAAGSAAAAPPEAVDIPGLAPAGEPAVKGDAAPAAAVGDAASPPQTAAAMPEGQTAAARGGSSAEAAPSDSLPAAERPVGASRGGAAEAAAADVAAAAASGFVFDDACRERLSGILARFCGTHRFHNFTVKMAASSPAARRYIISFACTGTFEIEGQQWVRMEVVGQSFMMHQIRRMVGMAVAEFRGAAPPGCIELALDTQRIVEVPMAPALGLLLHECCYNSYNDRWASEGGEGRAMLRLSDWAAAVDDFKASRVYPHIAASDAAEKVNALWLRGLTERAYHFSKWASARRVEATLPRVPARQPNGDASAAVVGAQETYGMRVASGGKRKFGGGDAVSHRQGRVQKLQAPLASQVNAEWSD